MLPPATYRDIGEESGREIAHGCPASSPLLAPFSFFSLQVVAEARQNAREHAQGVRVRSQLTPNYSVTLGKSFNWEIGNASGVSGPSGNPNSASLLCSPGKGDEPL